MNNFPSFLDNSGGGMANNNLRQAPSPGQPPNQVNGMGNAVFGSVGALHQAGQPSDMNVLWTMVQHLSEQLAEERRQSASLIRNVQQLEERVINESSGSPTVPQTNGEIHAPRAAELTTLQNELSTAHHTIAALESDNTALTHLLAQHEAALDLILTKLRPFAYAHAQALTAQKAHYTALLEQERQQNLELRLEHQEWQAGLGRVAEWARLAYRERSEGVRPYERRIRGLKNERRVLRRLVGWSEAEDSSDEEDEEGEGGGQV